MDPKEDVKIVTQAESVDAASVERAKLVIARVRSRQLQLAQQGRIAESAQYALRATRVRDLAPA